MLKSCKVTASCAEWESPAEVPVAVTVKLLVPSVGGIVNATVWLLPAAKLKGDAGDVVTPVGNPERVIATWPLNPFRPAVETANVEFEPFVSAVIAGGDTVRVKSVEGAGEGDVPVGVVEDAPPPQPMRMLNDNQAQTMTEGIRTAAGAINLPIREIFRAGRNGVAIKDCCEGRNPGHEDDRAIIVTLLDVDSDGCQESLTPRTRKM